MYSDAKIRMMLLVAAVVLTGMAVWQLVERLWD
jgi:hypothetical protein